MARERPNKRTRKRLQNGRAPKKPGEQAYVLRLQQKGMLPKSKLSNVSRQLDDATAADSPLVEQRAPELSLTLTRSESSPGMPHELLTQPSLKRRRSPSPDQGPSSVHRRRISCSPNVNLVSVQSRDASRISTVATPPGSAHSHGVRKSVESWLGIPEDAPRVYEESVEQSPPIEQSAPQQSAPQQTATQQTAPQQSATLQPTVNHSTAGWLTAPQPINHQQTYNGFSTSIPNAYVNNNVQQLPLQSLTAPWPVDQRSSFPSGPLTYAPITPSPYYSQQQFSPYYSQQQFSPYYSQQQFSPYYNQQQSSPYYSQQQFSATSMQIRPTHLNPPSSQVPSPVNPGVWSGQIGQDTRPVHPQQVYRI